MSRAHVTVTDVIIAKVLITQILVCTTVQPCIIDSQHKDDHIPRPFTGNVFPIFRSEFKTAEDNGHCCDQMPQDEKLDSLKLTTRRRPPTCKRILTITSPLDEMSKGMARMKNAIGASLPS